MPPPDRPGVDLPFEPGRLSELDPPANRWRMAVTAALVITIIGVAGAWVWLLTRDSEPTSTASRGAVVADEGGGDPPPASVRPTPDQAPAPPVQLPADAAYTQVTVLPGDDLAVQQWISSRAGPGGLRAAAPSPATGTGPVVADDLRLFADGTPARERSRVGEQPASFAFDDADSVYLSYPLSGALETSTSQEGRALARVTSLDLEYAAAGPATIAFRGAEVLALACSSAAGDEPPEPCGVSEGDAWLVEPDEATAGAPAGIRVMAQLDLE